MKKEKLSQAINEIDDSYIEEYYGTKDRLSSQKRSGLKRSRFLPRLAALFCALALCTAVVFIGMPKKDKISNLPIGNTGTESTDTDSSEKSDVQFPNVGGISNSYGEPPESFDFSEISGPTICLPPPDISVEIPVTSGEAKPPEPYIPPYSEDVSKEPPESGVLLLGNDGKTTTDINGSAVKLNGGFGTVGDSGAPPAFAFAYGAPAVVAKAVEELPHIYETLNKYGSVYTYRYRIFRMQVLDSLNSGIEGEFYYALPHNLKGDLTGYDSLLIATSLMGENYIIKDTEAGCISLFDALYEAPYGSAELGNIIAFTDGVFDESLWQDRSWLYGYQFARHNLENGAAVEDMLVSRGSTLQEALQRLASREDLPYTPTVNYTEEIYSALEYVKPFENGVFLPWINGNTVEYRRYIGGCPTNESLVINLSDGTVEKSAFSFDDADFARLPDLAAYVEKLDLESYAPQHTDTLGKRLVQSCASAWYEKTEDGVYCIVKLFWQYYGEDDKSIYIDESFMLITESGEKSVSREELIAIIGYNENISYEKYGVGVEMPME